MDTSNHIGAEAEAAACAFLEARGLRLRTKNHSCHSGELDLVMSEGETIVFVEVRKRKHTQYGNGIESVQPDKQARLMKAATHYLIEKELYDRVYCRFDIISINQAGYITWIKDAFTINYDFE